MMPATSNESSQGWITGRKFMITFVLTGHVLYIAIGILVPLLLLIVVLCI